MKTLSNNRHHDISRRIALFALLGLLTVPASGSATTPGTADATPTTADPDCAEAQVNLEIDVATGKVYLVDPATGSLTLTDNDIDVHFGSLGHVVIALHYSSSNWNVIVTPGGGSTMTYRTTHGWLRYTISDAVSEYTFSSMPLLSMSSMSSMTPIVPDIIIRSKPDCPPSP